MKKILVLCTGNSCRSQMAHGYLAFFANGSAEVYSAGIETHGVNPKAIKVMAEDGIDISGYTSNHVDEYSNIDFDAVITVCDNANQACPVYLSQTKRYHYNFSDPAKATGNKEEILNEFRKVRDQIKAYVQNFIQDNIDLK